MTRHEMGHRPEEARRIGIPTSYLFGILAAASVGQVLLLNRVVMTDAVVRSLLGPASAAQAEQYLAFARRWELVGTLLSPLSLLMQIGFIALLVQLSLLLFSVRLPLRRVFRAAVWAQAVLLLGLFVQTAWLATLPPGAVTAATLEGSPGSLAAFLPIRAGGSPSIDLLLQQITVFDLGWVAFFTLALEDGPRIRLAVAGAAIGVVWAGLTLSKWVMILYLTGAR